MLEFAGTTRCETRAAGVSQLSRDAAWLLMTLNQGTNKKSKIWGALSAHQLHASSGLIFPIGLICGRLSLCSGYLNKRLSIDALIRHVWYPVVMADQILSLWSIRDSKPDAVGVGAVERSGCGSKHHRVRRLLPWNIYPGVTIPRSCVKVKGTRARELNTVDSPFGRGVTEGSNMRLIFPVSNVNKMNRNLFMM